MTCQELLHRFKDALEKDEIDLETLQKLVNKCGETFGLEAMRAVAKKAIHYAVAKAWAYFKGSVIAKRDPAAAYGQSVNYIWGMADWYGMDCRVLADFATYAAEAVAKYRWPAKWPFLVPAAVAADVNSCELPDTVAEALGADEFARLEAFLEQNEAVVEVVPGLNVALVREGRFVAMVV